MDLQAGRRVGRLVEVVLLDLDVRRQVVGHRELALRVDVDLRRGAHVIGGLHALRRHVREVDLLVVGRPRVEGARHRRAEGVAVQEVGREPALDVLLREETEDLVAEGGVPAWHHVRETGWRPRVAPRRGSRAAERGSRAASGPSSAVGRCQGGGL